MTSYLLHIITLISLFSAFEFCRHFIENFHEGNTIKIFFKSLLAIWLSSIPVFAQLDARSRYQNYKLLRDLFYLYGFKYRFVRALRHSRCQRDAAYVAALESGFSTRLSRYYLKCGYRWYHLLPDFIWTKPAYLLSRHFWKTTFFARTYHSVYFNY